MVCLRNILPPVDHYMGSGYRNDRARDQRAQAASPGLSEGFVAPGYPVELRPPPPPPAAPVVVAPAAAAGAGAGAAWAAVGSVAIGLGLGFWVKRDIDRFKRDAKLPFYDTVQWQPSTYGAPVDFDLEDWLADAWQKYRTDLFIANTYGFTGDETVGFSGWAHPHWIRGLCSAGYQVCDGVGQDRWKNGCLPNTTQCNPGSCPGGFLTSTASTSGSFPPDGAAVIAAGCATIMVGRVRTGNALQVRGFGGYGWNGNPAGSNNALWTQTMVKTITGTSALVDAEASPQVEYELGWGTAVAPPGTQPSMDEQSAQQARMPRGKKRAGYTVPFSLAHPFTVIRVAPGTSSPVTVPDQVIDPGSETDPGGVVIVPPGQPPGNPQPDDDKKPWTRVLIKGGMLAINAGTETQDFVEAMHEGLPEHLRSKGRKGGDVPPWVILEDIWDNYDEWDAEVALEAFINNQIEDAIYGRFFGLQSRIQRRAGVTAGLGRGVKGYRPTKLVVPEVHFADGNHEITFGEWSLSW